MCVSKGLVSLKRPSHEISPGKPSTSVVRKTAMTDTYTTIVSGESVASMTSKPQSGHAKSRVAESHVSDVSAESEDRTIEQEILQVLYENLVRCGLACQLSIRSISRVVDKRSKEKQYRRTLNYLICDILESLPWASFCGTGYQGRRGQKHLAGKLYALKIGPSELARLRDQLMQRDPARMSDI